MVEHVGFGVDKGAPGLMPSRRKSYRMVVNAVDRYAVESSALPAVKVEHAAVEPDQLTGLLSFAQSAGLMRGLIDEANRQRRTLAFVSFDLDGFRLLRETIGQTKGDELIKRAAHIVKTISSPDAAVARHGTDGFIVVFTGFVSGAEAAVCVQQILAAIAVPCLVGGETLRITASAGVAMYPRDGTDLDTLSGKARGAARESKTKCPGALRFHSGNVTVLAKRRLRLEMDLRHAIENKELTLFFQPQFDVADGHMCGVEALTRWFRSDGSVVEPRTFIPLAEKTHVISELGAWVLKQACETVNAWRTRGSEPVTLCVNVSAHQINESFAKGVHRVLRSTGFPAKQLELEITESALISDAHTIIECFRRLKTMGARIAIDDFGTGYSSLNYLSRLPVDRLKLDKSLVHNLTTQWKDVAIARAVIELGKELGMGVIAEGVETEKQFLILKSLGCLQVQGYLLARPSSHNAARAMIGRPWGSRIMRSATKDRAPEVSNAS
jgi:diguanylate cyclase (GGDEF)-like protein